MARELRRIKIRDFGPSQSDDVESAILVVGERGIRKLTLLDDLCVEVVGDRCTYGHHPWNVSWSEPLPDLSPAISEPPSLEPEAPTTSFSAVAQPVEQLAVNQQDESSTLSCGAKPQVEGNSTSVKRAKGKRR